MLDGFGFVEGTCFNLYNVFIERRQHVSATTFYKGKETTSDKPQSDQFLRGKKSWFLNQSGISPLFYI